MTAATFPNRKINLTSKERGYLRLVLGDEPNVHLELRDPCVGASGGYAVHLDEVAIGEIERAPYSLGRGWVARRITLEGERSDILHWGRRTQYRFHRREYAVKRLIELARGAR